MNDIIEKCNLIYQEFKGFRQLSKLEEECQEFLDVRNRSELLEETADIFILSFQFYLNNPEVKKIVNFKLDRTLERIKTGYYKKGE